ncbi:MAG: Ig-like domain-containing protein [bacterium]|nr:Ig-like domain-containing protein [bacterium]
MYKGFPIGAAIAALLLFCACASQGPPPGGPLDPTPPRVVWTSPLADSVGVETDKTIRIRFDETMDRRSVERAIFISPRPASEPRYHWRGRELTIRLEDGLRPDRTYLVTVGRESADEWRNRMLASFSFAFSTGQGLSQGGIVGRVRPFEGGRGEVFVWAYDLQTGDVPDPGTDQPAYVTQPDATGGFRFPRLGSGNYRVFAFLDQDRDQGYDGGEPLAIPPVDVVLQADRHQVRLGDLQMTVHDTVAPRLISARTPDRVHLTLRFDEVVRISGAVSIREHLNVKAVYQDPTDSTRVGMWTDSQTSGETYRIRLDHLVDPSGNRLEQAEEIEVKGDGTDDRRSPEVVAQTPLADAVHVDADAPLSLGFSEAMKTDVDLRDFWVESDSTQSPEGRFIWPAVNRLLFVPTQGWTPGEAYRFIGRSGRLVDASDNPLKQAPAFRFSVLSPEALGELSGEIEPGPHPAVLEVHHTDFLDRQYRVDIARGDSVFSLDVVSGSYRILGFLDVDGNRQWSAGQVVPIVFAEPLFDIADTVAVRSRWSSAVGTRLRAIFFDSFSDEP